MRAETIAMLSRFGKNFEWLYLGNADFIRIEYTWQFFPKINLKNHLYADNAPLDDGMFENSRIQKRVVPQWKQIRKEFFSAIRKPFVIALSLHRFI